MKRGLSISVCALRPPIRRGVALLGWAIVLAGVAGVTARASGSGSSGEADDTVTLERLIREQGQPVRLRVGMSDASLREALGAPAATIGTALWLYFPVRATGRPDVADCDALVVLIRDRRVALLKLTRITTLRAMIERLRQELATPGAAQARLPFHRHETAS